MEVESVLRNDSKRIVKGAMLRVHPEFSFGLEGGVRFFVKTADGWKEVELKRGENWLRGKEIPLGAWAVLDTGRSLYLVNLFDPSQLSACMIYIGSEYYNLELFSKKVDLKPGGAVVIKHRYEVRSLLP